MAPSCTEVHEVEALYLLPHFIDTYGQYVDGLSSIFEFIIEERNDAMISVCAIERHYVLTLIDA